MVSQSNLHCGRETTVVHLVQAGAGNNYRNSTDSHFKNNFILFFATRVLCGPKQSRVPNERKRVCRAAKNRSLFISWF
jgi:hypothetical protein